MGTFQMMFGFRESSQVEGLEIIVPIAKRSCRNGDRAKQRLPAIVLLGLDCWQQWLPSLRLRTRRRARRASPTACSSSSITSCGGDYAVYGGMTPAPRIDRLAAEPTLR